MRFGKPIFMALLGAAALVAAGTNASASGMGGYLGISAGTLDIDWDLGVTTQFKSEGDLLGLGAGFVYDTTVARDELVNYRVMAGYEYMDINLDNYSDDEVFHDIYIDNFIGFGVYRAENMRVWVGPELRIGYMIGGGDTLTDDARGVELAIGPAVGINMHTGPDFSFALTGGIRQQYFWGNWEDPTGDEHDFDGDAIQAYFNIAILFRSLDDKFGAQ